MAYLPPHKRHSSTSTPTPTLAPSLLISSLHSLSLSSPRGGRCHHHSRQSNKIIDAVGCVSRWPPLPPFPLDNDDYDESLRLEHFPCDPIERKTDAKPLVLVSSSREGSSSSTEVAAATIAERFLSDLLVVAERVRTGDAPKEEEVKLSLVARVGKVLFQP